jgi:acetoacetyl-CoA reductase
VTGGMGGLGEPICKRLADDGSAVVALHSPSNPHTEAWLAAQEGKATGSRRRKST